MCHRMFIGNEENGRKKAQLSDLDEERVYANGRVESGASIGMHYCCGTDAATKPEYTCVFMPHTSVCNSSGISRCILRSTVYTSGAQVRSGGDS